MAEIKLESIHKAFDDLTVIKGVDIDINDGEFVVFVVPSGSGKSTLLRMIAGLEDITSGLLTIDGEEMNDVPPSKRELAMVFQSYALYPHMNVFDNLAFGLKLSKIDKLEIKERVEKVAEVLQIHDYLKRLPKQLSGGQRQRVAIGRAIIREPKVFLFDEPLSNLDAALRSDMRVELAELHEKLNATMIYVTHDQIEAMTMADKIVVLRDGVIEQVGSPMDLYHNPKTKFVAGFIGQPNMNFLKTSDIDIKNKKLTANIGELSLDLAVDVSNIKTGDEIDIGIRPEDLIVSSKKGGIPMTVDVVEHIGATVILYGSVLGNSNFCAVLPSDSVVKPGDTVNLALDPLKCHAFDSSGHSLLKS